MLAIVGTTEKAYQATSTEAIKLRKKNDDLKRQLERIEDLISASTRTILEHMHEEEIQRLKSDKAKCERRLVLSEQARKEKEERLDALKASLNASRGNRRRGSGFGSGRTLGIFPA